MKLRNLLITLGLTLTVGAGVAVATSVKQSDEPKAAEAASTSASATIWFTWSGSWNVDPYVSYCVGSSWTHMTTKCGTSGTSGTGSVTVPANTNTVIFAHREASGSWWGQTANTTIEIDGTKGLKNKLTVTCNSSSFGASWGYNTGLSNTISYNNNGGSGTISNQQIWLDNATLSNGSGFTKTGYTLSSWNTKADGSGTSYSLSGDATYKNFPNYVDGSSVILYAQWTATVYTITYDRNKNDGTQATQNKNYNTNVTAYTPGTSPINAEAWNPTAFKRFKYWNTAYDDTGDVVNAGSIITSNSSFMLYYIEDWFNYRYKVNNGSWVTLNSNTSSLPSGVQVQFTPSSAQSLPIGGILTFEYSIDGGTNWSTLNSITFEDGGNYNTTTGIQIATYDTIFLKLTTSGTYTCWVPGESERTILITDSATGTSGTSYAMVGTSSTETVTTASVYIEKGQYVRRCYAGTAYNTYYSGGTYSENTDDCFENITGSTAVLCTVTGVYTVKNFDNGDAQWWNIWVIRYDELSAGFLAQKFNSTISSICSGVTGGSKDLSDLQDAWGGNSDSALYYHFNGQPSDTMDYFATNASTTNTDILACVARYDYIMNKYGTSNLDDFLGRDNGYPESANRGFLTLFGQSGSLNNSVIIAVVISALGILSVGAYFFFRKSKKSEE